MPSSPSALSVVKSETLRDFTDTRLQRQNCAATLIGPDVNLYWDQAVYKKPGKTPGVFPGIRTTFGDIRAPLAQYSDVLTPFLDRRDNPERLLPASSRAYTGLGT